MGTAVPAGTTAPTTADGVYPVVDLQAGCLLGGLSKGELRSAAQLAQMLKGGERYRVYTVTGQTGESTGSKPESGPPCEELQEVEMTGGSVSKGVAIAGEWNAVPRVPKATSTADRVYREAVEGVLRENGIASPQARLTQVLRVDAEGDGSEEVFIVATNQAGGGKTAARAGDYSVVLMRKVIDGLVETVPLALEFYAEAQPDREPIAFTIPAIVDVDNDGTMDVVVYGKYQRGEYTKVYRVGGNAKPAEILSCVCGD